MKFWSSVSQILNKSSRKTEPVPDFRATMSEAHSLLNAKEYTKAREILLNAVGSRDKITDAPTIDWVLQALEASWLFQNQFEEQVAFFTDHLKKYPYDVAAYRARASALWYSDRLQDAVNDYSRALELNPLDILSRSGCGQVLAELGESTRAIEDLDVALRAIETTERPDESWVHWYRGAEAFARRGRGVALAGLGQFRQALNEFAQSIALSPENAWAYYSRARVYDNEGNHQGALSDYGAAMSKIKPPLINISYRRLGGVST